MSLTFWSVRVACLLYVVAVGAWLRGKTGFARAAWNVSFLFYLGHVIAAFTFVHHWSHDAAYVATAKQSGFGAGLYVNYFFTVLWLVDVIWTWNIASYRNRPKWISVSIQTFVAFMFINAAIVFASGPTRWIGLACVAMLALLLAFRTPHGGASRDNA